MNFKTRLVPLFAIALLSAASFAPAQTTQNNVPQDLDAFAARVLKEFEVPGLAVAIVKDGKVVLAKGYGVRKLGELTPVDENTLFGIASNTKAFTAAALAMLVDEGKISWDDAVTKHLPAFQLYDPYVTREMTIRDLLTHRSGLGLGAGDLLWWPPTDYSREEIIRRFRYVRPATSFRSRYAYDNVLYNWVAAFKKSEEMGQARATEAEKRLASTRAADSKPSLPLARYAGWYTDPWYGDVTISVETDKLVLRFSHTPLFVGELEHWQHDTFVARWRDRSLEADALVTFALKPDGSIEQMKMAAVSPLTDFSFDFQDLLFTPVAAGERKP